MGLILGPLVIFWLAMGVYVLRSSYALLQGYFTLAGAMVIGFLALLCFISYVYWGFSRFKKRKELWWCDIPLFFTANKHSLIAFALAFAAHWLSKNLLAYGYIATISAIAMFTISFGALAGAFGAGLFMKQQGIERTH
ncbi:hypothetical protein WNY77_09155 [Paraglaciecola mesophila]|uniref:Uncharacterized protein n=1 Tax=Paraglaciecola mesophila TaxID=197222 RepID=A0ABU9SUK5_9ALTE